MEMSMTNLLIDRKLKDCNRQLVGLKKQQPIESKVAVLASVLQDLLGTIAIMASGLEKR